MENDNGPSHEKKYQRFILKTGRAFYVYLAIAVSIIAIVDMTQFRIIKGMQISTADMMLQHRLHYPKPDKDIIIVDIDEASLAAMSEKLGRWPWPRQVIGEIVEGIEAQKAKAVVIDILFTSADLQSKRSDQYLTKVLNRYDNIFVPSALLDELDASQVKIATVPGAKKRSLNANDNGTTTIALPYFSQNISGERLGINNIVPDDDGVIRHFKLSQDRHGWEIPSLPLQIAHAYGYHLPASEEFTLNWRGPPHSFKRVSFSYVYSTLKSGNAAQLARDFQGKIVIIGSTAVSLFDLKTSPMAPAHPGVEIMATVLDNLKNDDHLFELSELTHLPVVLMFIWILAAAFFYKRTLQISDMTFIILQIAFIFVSFILLNVSNLYIDFTTPITFGAIYFAIARPYEYLSTHLRANRVSLNSLKKGKRYFLAVMVIQHPTLQPPVRRALCMELEKLVDLSAVGASKIDQFIEFPSLIRSMFDNTILVYWIAPKTDGMDHKKIARDATRIGEGIAQFSKQIRGLKSDLFQIGFKDGVMTWDADSAFHAGTDIVASAMISRQPIDTNWHETLFPTENLERH